MLTILQLVICTFDTLLPLIPIVEAFPRSILTPLMVILDLSTIGLDDVYVPVPGVVPVPVPGVVPVPVPGVVPVPVPGVVPVPVPGVVPVPVPGVVPVPAPGVVPVPVPGVVPVPVVGFLGVELVGSVFILLGAIELSFEQEVSNENASNVAMNVVIPLRNFRFFCTIVKLIRPIIRLLRCIIAH